MMVGIKEIKNKDGELIYPVTSSDAVFTSDGDTITEALNKKQDNLITGSNIKTINNESILGSGNINVGNVSCSSEVKKVNNIII